MIEVKRILFPTDFSANSRAAQQYARELVERFDCALHVLHVLPDPAVFIPEPGALFVPPEVLTVEQSDSAVRAMQQLFDAKWIETRSVVWAVLQGPPYVEIIRYAREKEIDLIVLGTHGRTGLAHVFLGSVAERVVRMAHCPVLTVRPPGHEFKAP